MKSKIEISYEELHVLVQDKGLRQRELAVILNTSRTNTRRILKKFGLETRRGKGGKLKRTQERYHCVCGETDPQKFYGNKVSYCAKCHNQYTLKKGQEKRKIALELLGNKCKSCNFDKYSCSLEIHHLDPTTKDVAFSNMRNWNLDRIIKELKLCVLLCSNCHHAVHKKLLVLE